jgi:uncharacterized membrane protein (UPF0127 family)
MNNIIETYLIFLENDNMMDNFLKKFKRVVSYHDPEEIEIGLLKYKEPPEKGTVFLFELPEEKVWSFHTVGMKFPIKISFWNSKKEVVFAHGVVQPGTRNITSKVPAKFAIEEPV